MCKVSGQVYPKNKIYKMENQDIIQEFAQQKTDSSLSTTDILKEYADSLKSEVSNDTIEPTEPLVESILEPTESIIEDTTEVVETVDTDEETEVEDILDEEDFIKQRTGGKYSTWEELEEAINQEKQAEISFENETSKAIYHMLAEGKINEVADLLQKKTFAETLKDKSEEDVLKAYIKATNPDFDKDDIEDEYNEKYVIDEYAFDDSKLKREQKKLNQRIKGDVANAKEFFNSLAEDIKFPQYAPQQIEEADNTEVEQARANFLSSLNGVEKRIGSLPFEWKDEKTNIAINGKFDIPGQELTKYREAAENLENYYVGRYYQDGKYNTDLILKDLYIADNFNKIVNSVVSQAVNQTRLETLKKSKNITVDNEPSATYKPSDAEEERNMFDKLFMGHLTRQQQ